MPLGHVPVTVTLAGVPEHCLGGLAEVRHQVDADLTDAEHSLQFEPFDQSHGVDVLVRHVNARS